MKIIVTGPKGMLGSTLLKELGEEGSALVADITDATEVMEEITSASPDVIIHTAAKTNIPFCEENPEIAYAVNTEGTKHIVDAARAVGARLIYISTVSVFSLLHGNAREEDVPKPENVYNRTKFGGERIVSTYDKGVIVRLNLIGVPPRGSRGRSFVEWLVDSFKSNKDISLYTDQRINPLSNWTIARLLIQMSKRDALPPILHLGSPHVLSKAEIGKMVALHFPNYTGHITYTAKLKQDGSPGQPTEMWLNVGKATALLEEMPTLESEIDLIFKKEPFC